MTIRPKQPFGASSKLVNTDRSVTAHVTILLRPIFRPLDLDVHDVYHIEMIR